MPYSAVPFGHTIAQAEPCLTPLAMGRTRALCGHNGRVCGRPLCRRLWLCSGTLFLRAARGGRSSGGRGTSTPPNGGRLHGSKRGGACIRDEIPTDRFGHCGRRRRRRRWGPIHLYTERNETTELEDEKNGRPDLRRSCTCRSGHLPSLRSYADRQPASTRSSRQWTNAPFRAVQKI
jgi:hypothetical protein